MNTKKQIAKILDQEIDRKEFFMYLGAALMSVVGISSIIKALGEKHVNPSASSQKIGYNIGAYGGNKKGS